MLAGLFGCIQKYAPKPNLAYVDALVVEGSLNGGQGQSLIKLSRTGSLSSPTQLPEYGAQVMVQGSDSTRYPLSEISIGNYGAQDLNLDSLKLYRLLITTSTGDNYVSEFVPVVPNPPIDSVNYRWEADSSVDVWVYTHNPRNNTRYYQWEFGETWEFHSAFASSLKYDTSNGPNGQVVTLDPGIVPFGPPLPIDTSKFICYQYDSSTQLILGNTAALSTDVIGLPIANIPPGSQKLSVLYSINVQQFGWSQAGYQFLTAMKSNTEALGSFFSPQPTQLASNIRCVNNSNKLAIGFFNISTMRQMRIFISNSELPDWRYGTDCTTQLITNDPDSIAAYHADNLLPVQPKDLAPIPFSSAKRIVTFTASYVGCVDCKLSGSAIKPAFWPQ
jgi:hypothetical protein